MSYGSNGSAPKMNGNGDSKPKPPARNLRDNPRGDVKPKANGQFGDDRTRQVAAQRNAKMRPAFNRRQPQKGKALIGLTIRQSNKLREHAKLHKGGMSSAHMKNMIRFQRAGDSFSVAHRKAVSIDKKKK